MKQIFILIGFISIVFCQDLAQNPKLGKTFGTNTGVFFNAGTNRLDLEGFFEIQSSQGLFGEIWVMQLDRDAETAAEVNSTFGWMKEVAPNMILGGGFSNYANQNLNEIFMGGNIGLLTLIGFFGLEESPTNLLGILDLNTGPFKLSPIGFTVMGIRESSGSDFYFRLTRDFDRGIKLGYTFSRERLEPERTFTKQGHTKSFTVQQEDGFFNTIYIGVTF